MGFFTKKLISNGEEEWISISINSGLQWRNLAHEKTKV